MTLRLGLAALLLPAKVAILPRARAMKRTAEESEGEEGVIGAAKVDRADNRENENDLPDHVEGGGVRVQAVAAVVVGWWPSMAELKLVHIQFVHC